MWNLLFDYDGCFAHTLPAFFAWQQHICNMYHVECPFKIAEDIHRGEFDPYPPHYETMTGKTWKEIEAEIEREWITFMQKNPVKPYPEMPQLIQRLYFKGYKIGMATSNRPEVVLPMLKNAGVHQYFSSVVTKQEAPNVKPSPDSLLYAMKRMGARADKTISIGDQPTDVIAARAAGIQSLSVGWGLADLAKFKRHKVEVGRLLETVEELEDRIYQMTPFGTNGTNNLLSKQSYADNLRYIRKRRYG